MVRHVNDHVPMGAAVAMSEQQIERLEAAIGDALDPVRQIAAAMAEKGSETPAPAVLSSEQFSELKALLQPGFELSSMMLADYKAQRAAALEPPAEKPKPSDDAQS